MNCQDHLYRHADPRHVTRRWFFEQCGVGLGVMAFVRLRYPTGNYRPFYALLDNTPAIVEAHHVTGEDCFVLKVIARSMRHLEEVTGRISGLGSVTTSVVYSSPLTGRAIAVD